jgi:hypothetical protein
MTVCSREVSRRMTDVAWARYHMTVTWARYHMTVTWARYHMTVTKCHQQLTVHGYYVKQWRWIHL